MQKFGAIFIIALLFITIQNAVAAPSPDEGLTFKPGSLVLNEGQKAGDASLNIVMQKDGNLVVYDKGKAIWKSNTTGKCNGCSAHYQEDGNLVLYDNNGKPAWALNSKGSKQLHIRNNAPFVSTYEMADAETIADGKGSNNETFGQRGLIPIKVVSSSGKPLCKSFSFFQIPNQPNLFVSKVRMGEGADPCAGRLTLGLFKFDWTSHVMTLDHLLVTVPVDVDINGPHPIGQMLEPSVAEFKNETWIAAECGALHVPGNSVCIAPLAGDGERIDTSRLSIPVSGENVDKKSPWKYSASTPKLLAWKGHLLLFWTAIQIDKAHPHSWKSVETRGAELELGKDGKLWVKGHPGDWVPSYSPKENMRVMSPIPTDPYRDTLVDTEGFYQLGDRVIALSSVGGKGPGGKMACTKPRDNCPGCFRLEITQTLHNPLSRDAFNEQRAVSPKFAANPVEYPRIVKGPDKQTYVMMNLHPMYAPSAPDNQKVLPCAKTGVVLVPISLKDLIFEETPEPHMPE